MIYTGNIDHKKPDELIMKKQTAKLFMNGRSQAVRLPQEFRFEGKEVYIYKEGDQVILSPKSKSWEDFFINSPFPSPDFMIEREDIFPQTREDLF